MAQTEYKQEHVKAVPGLLADVRPRVVESKGAEGRVDFGLGVVRSETNVETDVKIPRSQQKLVFDADFVASNVINGTVNLVAYAEVAFNTDHDTTAADFAAALSALDGVTCVVDTTDATNRTFLVDVFEADAVVTATVTGGAGQATATITSNYATIFRGWAVRSLDNEQDSNGQAYYKNTKEASILKFGSIWVPYTGAAPAVDATVYLQASGSNAGYATATSTNNIDTGGIFKQVDTTLGLAEVSVDKG